MPSLRYLPGLVPFTLGLYLALVLCAYWRYWVAFRAKMRASAPEPDKELPERVDPTETHWQAFFRGGDFSLTYRASWEFSWGKYTLLAWRLAFFGYFFGITFLWGYVNTGMANAFYFTLWNVDLISLYFLCALVASAVGLWEEARAPTSERTEWSASMLRFGDALQILFEVAGGTAFFVTVVAFGALNPRFSFWNVNEHFVTSVGMLGELALSRMTVRSEHVIFQVTWALLWLMFCWPMVGSKALDDWPYFFLDASSPSVFAWYTGLFVLVILFYFMWFWLAYLKEYVAKRFFVQTYSPASVPSTLWVGGPQAVELINV